METHCLDTTADHTVWCPQGDSEVLLLSHLWLGASRSCYTNEPARGGESGERAELSAGGGKTRNAPTCALFFSVQKMSSCLVPLLISGLYILPLLPGMRDFGPFRWTFGIRKVCRWMFWVKGWSPPHPLHIQLHSSPLPCAGIRNIPLCKGDLFLFAFVRLRYGSQNYCPLFPYQTGERKTLTVWMSVFVFALKYGLFMLRFMHLCVWRGGGLGWKWPCMNCCPVFLHCPESTVICPP